MKKDVNGNPVKFNPQATERPTQKELEILRAVQEFDGCHPSYICRMTGVPILKIERLMQRGWLGRGAVRTKAEYTALRSGYYVRKGIDEMQKFSNRCEIDSVENCA